MAAIGAYLFYQVISDQLYTQILTTLSRFLILQQMARFYIEVVRGVPILVLLLYIAFVLAPLMVAGDHCPDDQLFRLYRRGVPGRATVG